MDHSLLLVHSPLVGPSTWTRLAQQALSRGFEAVVADITGGLEAPSPVWAEMVRLATTAARRLTGTVDVVAHSGAGALLPGIGMALGRRRGKLCFVDAVLPPPDGAHRYPDDVRSRVEELAQGDTLPPWLEWFPQGVVTELLPRPDDRELVVSDLPSVPTAWFEEAIPVPGGWTEWHCSYLRLSEAYDDELGRARRLGWPTASLPSHHLGIVTDPGLVLDSILELGA